VLADPILYGDFHNILDSLDTAEAPPRLYKDVGSYSTLQPLFESLLAAYNAKHKPMQLVFFDDALEHLTRIIRTLRLPMVRLSCTGKLCLESDHGFHSCLLNPRNPTFALHCNA